MSLIRPIAATFRPTPKHHRLKEEDTAPDSHPNLPVPVQTRSKRQNTQYRLLPSSGFAVQLLAGPPARGLKAGMAERARYVAAYRRIPNPVPTKVEKWA